MAERSGWRGWGLRGPAVLWFSDHNQRRALFEPHTPMQAPPDDGRSPRVFEDLLLCPFHRKRVLPSRRQLQICPQRLNTQLFQFQP